MEFVGKNYVRIGNNFISTKTGKRFDATPEGLDALEKDNGLIGRAEAGRASLPVKARSVNFRIAQEKADTNPKGPNPFEAALIVARANIAISNFTDRKRQEEIPDLEAASKQFEERRAKLAELPQPAPQNVDPVRKAAEILRARPDKLGERLSETVANRLDQKAQQEDQARAQAAAETARTSDDTFLRAVKLLELKIHQFERSVVPSEWIDNAKAQLEQVRVGTITPYEFWHAYEPEWVNTQAGYYETLTANKKAEIAEQEKQLADLKAGNTPPADEPPAVPVA